MTGDMQEVGQVQPDVESMAEQGAITAPRATGTAVQPAADARAEAAEGWEGHSDDDLPPVDPTEAQRDGSGLHAPDGWDPDGSHAESELASRLPERDPALEQTRSPSAAAGAAESGHWGGDTTGPVSPSHPTTPTTQAAAAAAAAQGDPEGWGFEDTGWDEPSGGETEEEQNSPARAAAGQEASASEAVAAAAAAVASACTMHACWAALVTRALETVLPGLPLQWLDHWHGRQPWLMTQQECQAAIAAARSNAGAPPAAIGQLSVAHRVLHFYAGIEVNQAHPARSTSLASILSNSVTAASTCQASGSRPHSSLTMAAWLGPLRR